MKIEYGLHFQGTKIDKNGYLGFYDTQLTVIKEGNEQEFLGWALPHFGNLVYINQNLKCKPYIHLLFDLKFLH